MILSVAVRDHIFASKYVTSDVISSSISCVTWNLANTKLTLNDCQYLDKFKNSDIVALGVQECGGLSSSDTNSCLRQWNLHKLKILGYLKFLCRSLSNEFNFFRRDSYLYS